MYAYFCPHCGLVAFELYEKKEPGQMVLATDVVLKDGSHPAVGSEVKCQECGQKIKPHTGQILKRTEH